MYRRENSVLNCSLAFCLFLIVGCDSSDSSIQPAAMSELILDEDNQVSFSIAGAHPYGTRQIQTAGTLAELVSLLEVADIGEIDPSVFDRFDFTGQQALFVGAELMFENSTMTVESVADMDMHVQVNLAIEEMPAQSDTSDNPAFVETPQARFNAIVINVPDKPIVMHESFRTTVDVQNQ